MKKQIIFVGVAVVGTVGLFLLFKHKAASGGGSDEVVFQSQGSTLGSFDPGTYSYSGVATGQPTGESTEVYQEDVPCTTCSAISSATSNFASKVADTVRSITTIAPAVVSTTVPATTTPAVKAMSPLTAFIESQYQQLLGRSAENEGLDYWGTKLNSGAISANDLDDHIKNSSEYKTTHLPQGQLEFIENEYQSLLGRHADQGGLDYWQQQINSGAIKPEDLDDHIRNSGEYIAAHQ